MARYDRHHTKTDRITPALGGLGWRLDRGGCRVTGAEDAAELGAQIRAETPYDDPPYGLVTHFIYERGDVWWLYTSEHTDASTVDDLWLLLPHDAYFSGSESCAFAPEFKHVANSTRVHYMISHREGEPIARIQTKELFAAQILGRLQ